MDLPFSTEQFFAVFAAYNAAIWPAQLIAYALGLAAVGALWADGRLGKRLILWVLALFWAWNGIAYHYAFFASVNPAAKLFAAMFVLQAALLAAAALTRNELQFHAGRDVRSAVGLGFIVYALLVYEVLGYLAGHGLMRGPLFGVAPCPTTIFTIGMLLLARGAPVVLLSVVPVLWALIGTSAAVLLGVPEDFGLAAAAGTLLVALAAGMVRRPRPG